MNKFWEWMIKNRYGNKYLDDSYSVERAGNYNNVNEIPKQMLIGYMIEYVMDYYKMGISIVGDTIDEIYNELESMINGLG